MTTPVRARRLLVPALALALAACGPDTPAAIRVQALAHAASTTQIAGPLGMSVEIPAGALTVDTTITITTIPGGRLPPGSAAVAVPMRLEPSGQTFAHAVEIGIPISPSSLPAGKTLADVVVYRASAGSTVFVPLPTRPAGPAIIVVATEHFSDFVAVVSTSEAGVATGCGDGVCSGETCTDCPMDCGLCLPAGECGTGPCEASCGFGCTNATTVLDNANGLDWQRDAAPGTYTFAGAASYCAGLVLGGLPAGTWRVPTRMELASHLDYGRANPSIDDALYPTPVTTLWSSTASDAFGIGTAWHAQVGQGNLRHLAVGSQAGVRCVRTVVPRSGVLVDNLDGTVTDTSTGTIWEQNADPTAYIFADASSHCASLVLGGLPAGSWRLPTLLELLSIVYETPSGGLALDPMVFPSPTPWMYVTSTITVWAGGTRWGVDFYMGQPFGSQGATALLQVRCVR